MAMVVCPCCGHRALTGDGDSFCPVCAWDERDHDDGWPGRPPPGLDDAQRSFQRIGASDPALTELTRPPLPAEAPPPWWHTFDDERLLVRALIEDAFRDVRLDGGTTVDEAELIDDYALPSRTVRDRPPPGYHEPPPWQDLTGAGLDRFPWGNFPFHDARGLRYYLPAYVCAHLSGHTAGAFESLVYTLESGHQLPALDLLLDGPQHHAVARFFAHLATTSRYYSRNATAALRNLWGTHLDPDHLAHVLR